MARRTARRQRPADRRARPARRHLRATASGHLRRLVDERRVTVERAGASHQVRLADPAVAQLLESIAALAAPGGPPTAAPATTSASARHARELRFARTCYDHLAGVVGVAVTRALLDRRWLRPRDDSFAADPRSSPGSPSTATGSRRHRRRAGRWFARAWTRASAYRTWPARSAPRSPPCSERRARRACYRARPCGLEDWCLSRGW